MYRWTIGFSSHDAFTRDQNDEMLDARFEVNWEKLSATIAIAPLLSLSLIRIHPHSPNKSGGGGVYHLPRFDLVNDSMRVGLVILISEERDHRQLPMNF